MPSRSNRLNLRTLPGHVTRRVHQLAVALFNEEVGELNLTPVQYSSLQTICDQPGIDQTSLANAIGYDKATIGGVIDRLEARGLVVRNMAPTDRRLRLITPTEAGYEMLQAVQPRMLRSQDRLLEPLTPAQRKELMRLMTILVDANAELSNIPTRS